MKLRIDGRSSLPRSCRAIGLSCSVGIYLQSARFRRAMRSSPLTGGSMMSRSMLPNYGSKYNESLLILCESTRTHCNGLRSGYSFQSNQETLRESPRSYNQCQQPESKSFQDRPNIFRKKVMADLLDDPSDPPRIAFSVLRHSIPPSNPSHDEMQNSM